MKTQLPVSRNRNLPRPEAPAPVAPPPGGPSPDSAGAAPAMSRVERRRPAWEPPAELSPVQRLVRGIVGMLVACGALGGIIYLYVVGVSTEGKREATAREVLAALGPAVWERGSTMLRPADAAAEAALADLPMALIAAKRKAGVRFPDISVVDGDPPPGKGTATHQIVYFVRGEAVLLLRMHCDPEAGRLEFVGQENRVLPPKEAPPVSPDAAAGSPESAPAAEKVSEQP